MLVEDVKGERTGRERTGRERKDAFNSTNWPIKKAEPGRPIQPIREPTRLTEETSRTNHTLKSNAANQEAASL